MLVRFDSPITHNNLLDNFFSSDVMPSRCACAEPAMDIVEQENELVVTAELPGMKKEDVKITFEKNVLSISGERKHVELPENAKVLLKENQSENFSRSIKLGFEIDSSKISAEMSNGILTITLPKTEAVRAREISIN
jgi:HSP20 family protein